MVKIRPGTRSREHFEQAERMFLENLSEMECPDRQELYKNIYGTLTPTLKRNLFEDLIDYDLAIAAIADTPATTSKRLQEIVDKDFDQKMKKLNIGKWSSNKAKELLISRAFIVKIVDYKTVIYMPTLTRQGLYFHVLELAEFKSAVGSLYVLTPGSGTTKKTFVIHSHVFERYNQRSGNSEGYGDAQKWLFKEIITSSTSLDGDDLTLEGRLCRGRVFPNLKMVIPSGILLGSSYPVTQDVVEQAPKLQLGNRIVYLKTYVSMDMLSKEQDEEHREAWEEIYEALTPIEKKVINSSR